MLENLLALEEGRRSWEILVVDDGGSTDLHAALGDLPDRLPLRVLRQPHRGPGSARNYGASEALGRLLLFTDDDCRPDRRWLSAFCDAHERAPDALLGGMTENGLPANRWSTTSEYVVVMARLFYNRAPDGPRFFASNNMAVPTDRFLAVGGFDSDFGFASEDRDLCDRWRHRGLPLVEVPAARVAHAHPLQFSTFFRQHLRYGSGAWTYHQKRRERGSGTLREDLAFYTELYDLFKRAVPTAKRGRTLLPMLLWQLANTLGFFGAAIRHSLSAVQRSSEPANG